MVIKTRWWTIRIDLMALAIAIATIYSLFTK